MRIKAHHAVSALSLLATMALSACASDTMKTYVGTPVESVIIDYGPPTAVVDLGPGERAYQWRKISTNVVAGSRHTEIRDTRGGVRYETRETPDYVNRQECFYTFFARLTERGWSVTGFRSPTLECE
ncbi:MAG: hypothetical protein J0H01_11365 [Rhizobiales bacterium]|nr:hypothetical protein [Hyphomicrobiales bacterium]